MAHADMYTPPFSDMCFDQCLCGSERYGMRLTRVIAGDERWADIGAVGFSWRLILNETVCARAGQDNGEQEGGMGERRAGVALG
jgi:hypothetical protein